MNWKERETGRVPERFVIFVIDWPISCGVWGGISLVCEWGIIDRERKEGRAGVGMELSLN